MTESQQPESLAGLSVRELEQKIVGKLEQEAILDDEGEEWLSEMLQRGAQGNREAVHICVRLLCKEGIRAEEHIDEEEFWSDVPKELLLEAIKPFWEEGWEKIKLCNVDKLCELARRQIYDPEISGNILQTCIDNPEKLAFNAFDEELEPMVEYLELMTLSDPTQVEKYVQFIYGLYGVTRMQDTTQLREVVIGKFKMLAKDWYTRDILERTINLAQYPALTCIFDDVPEPSIQIAAPDGSLTVSQQERFDEALGILVSEEKQRLREKADALQKENEILRGNKDFMRAVSVLTDLEDENPQGLATALEEYAEEHQLGIAVSIENIIEAVRKRLPQSLGLTLNENQQDRFQLFKRLTEKMTDDFRDRVGSQLSRWFQRAEDDEEWADEVVDINKSLDTIIAELINENEDGFITALVEVDQGNRRDVIPVDMGFDVDKIILQAFQVCISDNEQLEEEDKERVLRALGFEGGGDIEIE